MWIFKPGLGIRSTFISSLSSSSVCFWSSSSSSTFSFLRVQVRVIYQIFSSSENKVIDLA